MLFRSNTMLIKEAMIHASEKEHDKEIQTKEIMADAFKNIFNAQAKS